VAPWIAPGCGAPAWGSDRQERNVVGGEALAAFAWTLDDGDVTVGLAGIEAARELRIAEAVSRLLDRLGRADQGAGAGTEINAILDALAVMQDPRAEPAPVCLRT
jgi:hypothetical protein